MLWINPQRTGHLRNLIYREVSASRHGCIPTIERMADRYSSGIPIIKSSIDIQVEDLPAAGK